MADISITLRCFSHVKHLLDRNEMSLTFPQGATAGDVLAHVRELLADRQGRMVFLVAVNQSIADSDTVLSDGDEVALLPPMQGG